MRILVWTSKYRDYYYAADTPEELEASAQKILEELIENQWVTEPEPPTVSEKDEELLALTEEQVQALPTALRQETAQRIALLKRKVCQEDAYGRLERQTWEKGTSGKTWVDCTDRFQTDGYQNLFAKELENFRRVGFGRGGSNA